MLVTATCGGSSETIPRATYAVLDFAGHNLQIEQPALFNSLVENWLERLERS